MKKCVICLLAGFLAGFSACALASTRYRLEPGMKLRDNWAGRIYQAQGDAWVPVTR